MIDKNELIRLRDSMIEAAERTDELIKLLDRKDNGEQVNSEITEAMEKTAKYFLKFADTNKKKFSFLKRK